MTPEDVSRETRERLELFCQVIEKWNTKINLVSKASMEHLWDRHILDSMQILSSTDRRGKWVDLGSGGGFPGIVVAILLAEEQTDNDVVLIESDQRKAAFLRTAVRETGVRCTVISERIENTVPQEADVLSARALTDLSGLLIHAERHLKSDGVAVFPKGVRWEKEVEAARRQWSFQLTPVKSRTESGAAILKIEGMSRV